LGGFWDPRIFRCFVSKSSPWLKESTDSKSVCIIYTISILYSYIHIYILQYYIVIYTEYTILIVASFPEFEAAMSWPRQ
jgi:hypothetical protein